jgi:predicted amidohydrolase
MKINLIQTDIVWGDPQANCAHLDKLLAGAEPAELYVLPEMFSTGFATLPNATVEHEPAAGLAWMQRKAQELHAAIAGSIALEVGEKCVNRFYFVRPDGTYEQYDKRHLFGYGGEG